MPTVENNKKEQGKRNEKTREECKQARAVFDRADIEWAPIASRKKYVMLRYPSGHIFFISNSYGIRAFNALAQDNVSEARGGM